MKKISVLAFFGLFATQLTFAAGTIYNCKSKNYELLLLEENGAIALANYSINGISNDAADVTAGKQYISNRILAVSLTVDYQADKFELVAKRDQKNNLVGTIFFNKTAQPAKCSVTAREI